MTEAAVIGLGTMGAGIAATLAAGGMTVRGFDAEPAARSRAAGAIATASRVLGAIRAAAPGGTVAVVDTLADAVGAAELIVEAVPENPDIKAATFAAIEAAAPAGAILASNTSGIPITRLQEAVKTPARLVGMHWSNPPHVIPIIEVIPGAHTAPAIADRLTALIEGFGHKPVRIRKDVAGFVHNRVLYALLREAVALVEDGVIEAADLDTLVKWSVGLKLSVIGPLELLDVAGLDIYKAVSSYLNAALDNRAGVAPMIAHRADAGALGIKSGRGIYDYPAGAAERLGAERARRLIAVRRTLDDA
ncbi:MAG: 3-hydroxyacyl-CoA dehydrogenase family protein [Alphaproteobacteria bacterium]|nr:3-hydroxyacyl-CoA dehydrogenase family protein [Alphaproteobacteria bacterium]